MTKLKKMRKESGLKLRQIAEIIKTTPQTVQQMEKKGIQTPRTARRYAQALNCKPEDLIEW